jgi:hypothetical protein
MLGHCMLRKVLLHQGCDPSAGIRTCRVAKYRNELADASCRVDSAILFCLHAAARLAPLLASLSCCFLCVAAVAAVRRCLM